jgi:HEAT repeat protein
MTDTQTIASIRQGLTDPDRDLRRESVEALVALGDLQGLRAALGSRDSYLRLRAVKALAPLAGEATVLRFTPLAWDSVAEVRLAVAAALAERGGWLATWVLRHLAADPHPTVRYAALVGLAHVDRRWACARLRVVADTDDQPWIREAATALLHQCASTNSNSHETDRTADDAHGCLEGMN